MASRFAATAVARAGAERREELPPAADLKDTDSVFAKPRRVRRLARAIPHQRQLKSESRVSATSRKMAHEMRFPVS
jgi:hypothetical protein